MSATRAAEMVMEEKEMCKLLTDASYNKREDVLSTIQLAIRETNQSLPFINSAAVFKALSVALTDENWDVRCQVVKLINDLVPLLGEDCDGCVRVVIAPLVARLGDQKMTVCNAAMVTLNTYARYTADFQLLLQNIVRHGVASPEIRVKRAVAANVSFLIAKEHRQRNLRPLAEALVHALFDADIEDARSEILRNLDKMKQV